MEPDNLALDRYILAASGAPNPKVCFLPTASGDAQTYIDRFYASFGTLPCTPAHLSLFLPHTTDIRSFLLEQNVIYVGGGSTRNLLVLWREWELDAILREAWQAGVVLAGLSAGSLCWFQEGVSDSVRRRSPAPRLPRFSTRKPLPPLRRGTQPPPRLPPLHQRAETRRGLRRRRWRGSPLHRNRAHPCRQLTPHRQSLPRPLDRRPCRRNRASHRPAPVQYWPQSSLISNTWPGSSGTKSRSFEVSL